MESPSVRVAIIGAGTVGAALVAMLNDHTRDAALHEAVGGTVEIVGIAVRDLQRPRPGIAQELLTTDADALVARDDVDIVVELAGGSNGGPARAARRVGGLVPNTCQRAARASDARRIPGDHRSDSRP